MKDRFEVIREWSPPLLRKEDTDYKFKEAEDATHYCFIRLYQTEYKSVFSIGGLTKEVNSAVTRAAQNGLRYTHAAMNYQLNDNFIGMNFSENKNNDIVIEHLRTMDKGKPYQDKSISRFDVFYIKLTKEEYIALKKKLISVKTDSKFKYDYLRLLMLVGDQLYNRIKRFLFSAESEEVTEHVDIKDIMLVCSTFVSYILSNVSKRFDDFFKKSKYSLHSYTPNELTYLPGITHMYGGYWKEYASKTREYLRDHPEFEEYMK